MLNSCTFIGNLGKNPDIRTMSNSKEVASFSIAVSEYWKDKQTDEWKNKTQWIPVVAFSCIEHIKKLKVGDKVFVQGKFQTRDYEKDGEKRYITEIMVQGFDGKVINLMPKEKKEEKKSELQLKELEIDDEIPF